MTKRQLKKELNAVKEALLDTGIEAAIYKHRCKKLEDEVEFLNAALDATIDKLTGLEKKYEPVQ